MHFCLSGPCSQPQIFSESTPKPTPIGLLRFCIFLQICFKCSLALSQELKQKSSIHKYGILWLLFASEDASAAHQHEHTTSYLGTGRGLNFTPFWGVRDLVHSLNVLWRTTRPYQSFRTYRYASKPIEWNMHLESHLKKKKFISQQSIKLLTTKSWITYQQVCFLLSFRHVGILSVKHVISHHLLPHSAGPLSHLQHPLVKMGTNGRTPQTSLS